MEAQGERYVVKGKERLVLNGSLKRSTGPARSIQIVRDIQGRFRLDEQGSSRAVAFDGEVERVAGRALNTAEKGELESLARDTPEEFYAAVGKGAALRVIGRRMRGDDGSTPSYQGPWYDVYEISEGPQRKRSNAPERKFFYFNSETSELALVRYVVGTSMVRTVLSNWQTAAGEKFPGKVERVVDGQTVFTFEVSQVNLAPDAADSFFTGVN